MDNSLFWIIIGAVITMVSLLYLIIRNFKEDLRKRFENMENRLDIQSEIVFELGTGKTLKEAMIEAKNKTQST